MDIKDFIKGTISDISDAVRELNAEKGKDGLIVAPANYKHIEKVPYLKLQDERIVELVEFNLAVTVSDKSNTDGGLKISILNAGINNEAATSTCSTIRFSIPVVLPSPGRSGRK